MPHDANDSKIEVGDTVYMPFVVQKVYSVEEFCNVDLQSVYPMPGRNEKTNLSEVNTKQLIKSL